MLAAIRNWFCRESPMPACLTDEQMLTITQDVCTAIRLGFPQQAMSMLESAGAAALRDASCLNLMGVIQERLGRWDLARRYYGRAMRADGRYQPAQQNMRRWYELYTLGCSTERIAQLGDEKTALAELLRSRDRMVGSTAGASRQYNSHAYER